jgi:hypothetical protein
MKKLTICITVIIASVYSPSISFAELDSASKDALEKTQDLLTDQQKRDAAIKGDANAEKADAYAKSIGGNNTNEIYALASKVMQKLVTKYNGDVNKIKEVMDKAAKDPAGFASAEFSAEELQALRSLSSKLPAQTGSK